MNTKTPDTWVVLKFTSENDTVVEKVFAGWYGGYLGGDSWQLNSGNKSVIEFEDRFQFTGYSGSVYVCYKACEKMSSYQSDILGSWEKQFEADGKARVEVINDYSF